MKKKKDSGLNLKNKKFRLKGKIKKQNKNL